MTDLLDPRLGRRAGDDHEYPTQFANGQSVDRRLRPFTTVLLGNGYYCILPSGKGSITEEEYIYFLSVIPDSDRAGVLTYLKERLSDAQFDRIAPPVSKRVRGTTVKEE
jgi:hypothetical protein